MNQIREVFKKGCLIDLDVGVWPAERRLQPDDLGLTKEEVPPNFVLGHKKLIPAGANSEVRKWESKARKTVEKYSFPFTVGGGRFVPRPRMLECVTELEEIIVGFDHAADKLVAEYDQHRLAMRSEFVQAAHDAYHRKVLLCGGLTQSEGEYVNQFLARVDKVYPSVTELRRKYHMEYVVFQTQLDDITRATYEDVAQDTDKIRLLQETFVERIRQRVNSFAETAVVNARSDAREVLERTARVLRNGKRVTKYTMDAVRKMIARYSDMDLVGDEGFKERLKSFKDRVLDVYEDSLVVKDKGHRDNVTTEIEALALMAADDVAIRNLVDKYRKELAAGN